jgi:hypothetical protein
MFAEIKQKKNIQQIYYGKNTTFVENIVGMKENIIYVKAIENMKNVQNYKDKNGHVELKVLIK